MFTETKRVEDLIRTGTADLRVTGKIGKSLLQPRIADVLTKAGYDVDVEDLRCFLPGGLPVWRDKADGKVVATPGRRRIDLVVRNEERVVALIETESDLNDLRETGVSGRSGNYDVFSIAQTAKGGYFHSYKSLERMAAAAWYAAGKSQSGLERLTSDAATDHNPLGIGIILVTGFSRSVDRAVLAPRLASLGAKLISLIQRP